MEQAPVDGAAVAAEHEPTAEQPADGIAVPDSAAVAGTETETAVANGSGDNPGHAGGDNPEGGAGVAAGENPGHQDNPGHTGAVLDRVTHSASDHARESCSRSLGSAVFGV